MDNVGNVKVDELWTVDSGLGMIWGYMVVVLGIVDSG
jgi:hypothetical protein